jgi:molybdopterin synthase catalytic subunit
MTAAVTIRIQEADFDVAQEIAALTRARTDIGAVVSFSGICRDSESGGAIAALTLEHYPGMAEAEIARHAETAMSRWPLTGADRDSPGRPHRPRRKHRAGGNGLAASAGGV